MRLVDQSLMIFSSMQRLRQSIRLFLQHRQKLSYSKRRTISLGGYPNQDRKGDLWDICLRVR